MSIHQRWFIFAITIAAASLVGSDPAGRLVNENTMAVAATNNTFGVELYGKLKERPGNLFFSPYSISECLGLAYGGAQGQTKSQMAAVLHFGEPTDQAAFSHAQLQLNRAATKNGIEINSANGLWTQRGQPIALGFLNLAQTQYEAEVKQVDFIKESTGVAADINSWVAGKTKGKINEIISGHDLNSNSRLVLVNALYFKGKWKKQFNPKSTQNRDFFIGNDNVVQCPMMVTGGKFRYLRREESSLPCEILELPYLGGDYSFVVILPHQIGLDWLSVLENKLTEPKLKELLASMEETKMGVVMPKFKFETEMDLTKTLSAMGMRDAFGLNADFSGIESTKNLFITSVRHRALVGVDEEGTVAAAVTGAAAGAKSKEHSIQINHPFLFLIRDNRSESILFLGRLVDPTSKTGSR